MTAKHDAHDDMSLVRDRFEKALPIIGDGPAVMLNMLRFRTVADYSQSPELAPDQPISGAEAYARYLEATEHRMKRRGVEILFTGRSGPFLIGPESERWDMILMVRWPDAKLITSSGGDAEYLAVAGHRTAALEDSRLLPIFQTN